MTQPDALRGPWKAVISASLWGTWDSYAEAVLNLGEDYDAEVIVSVRRGSALAERGSYDSGDIAYEVECYLFDGDASIGAEHRMIQAQAMADGLNAATKAVKS